MIRSTYCLARLEEGSSNIDPDWRINRLAAHSIEQQTMATESQHPKKDRAVIKYFLLLLAVSLVSSLAVFLVPDRRPQIKTDLISRAVESIDIIVPSFESSDPQILTDFIRGQFEWDASPPHISEASLRGAGIQEIVEGFDLPAFIYEDRAGGSILVYTLSYRVLDDNLIDLEIEENILQTISEEYQLVVARAPLGSQAVMWREYSFIFLAVTASEDPVLLSRVNPKRSP